MDERPPRLLALIGLMIVQMAGCHGEPEVSTTTRASVLRVATTTSTRDSGLLDELLPRFEQAHGCRVDVVAVGTGAALKLGEAGDADVVIVHARDAEEAFMQAGHGVRHEEFMYNDFVILGPPDDPAGIRDLDPLQAMRLIAAGGHRFVSRADNSGTHQRELALWEQLGGRPDWSQYVESGQGMGPALVMASEKQAYLLADTGTYLGFQDKVELAALAAHSELLRNPYAVIVVDPAKHERTDAALANKFVDFLLSAEVQQLIGGYQVAGRQLFHPTRLDDKN